jgi:hypothetical protein
MKYTHERKFFFSILVLIILVVSGCSSKPVVQTTSLARLTIEEYPLKFKPTIDPLVFTPEEGSQEEILAPHQEERDLPVADNSVLFEGKPAYSVKVAFSAKSGEQDLVAFETYTDTVSSQGTFQKVQVQVLDGTQLILSDDAGDVSPICNLRGLWTYSEHWVLEVAHVSLTPVSNETPLQPSGEIFLDGKSLNNRNGYDQTFGFQLMKGKPFYFFQQNGKIGVSYDGDETDLDYDQIPHYQCCSEAELNPKASPGMVSFFAVRQGTWYYVEIGDFEQQVATQQSIQ